MKYDFSKGGWNPNDFMYAASNVVPYRSIFVQEKDCISNVGATDFDDYAYISMVLRKPVTGAFTLSTESSFVKYGAPLFVIADSLKTLTNGNLEYERHIEVVGWENGINVWELTPDETAPKGRVVKSLGKFVCPVGENEKFRMTCARTESGLALTMVVGDRSAAFDCPCEMAESVYVGLTACEGENRFYDFIVE